MKNIKTYKTLFLLIILFAAIYYLISLIPLNPSDQNEMKILIVKNNFIPGTPDIIKGYASVLEEEGVNYKVINPSYLLCTSPEIISKTAPAIIFPDQICSKLPYDILKWITEYIIAGGNVLSVYDTGTKNMKNTFTDRAIFSDLIDANYILYNKLKNKDLAYVSGTVRFKDRSAADYFEIPPGKTDKGLYINGYRYGRLNFTFAQISKDKGFKDKNVLAYGEREGRQFPLIIRKRIRRGIFMHINLPLGKLKINADDLYLRSVLRAFLFREVKLPHLMNTPDAKGGLIINWHIDWKGDYSGLEYMKKLGFCKKNIVFSLHNTAGPDNNKPGDKLGFDACGKGRPYLKSVLKNSVLGSHGGWLHNWFSHKMEKNLLSAEEIKELVIRNSNCLEEIAGYKIREYSAPSGVHPQPLMTNIIEKLGFTSYYYTGDSASFPNRTFFNGKMVSNNVIAFPILSYTKSASFFEMNRNKISKDEMKEWFSNIINYIKTNRTIRLLYSHSYDIQPYYPDELKTFLDNVENQVLKKKMYAKSMTYFRNFQVRFLKTRTKYILKKDRMVVKLKNREGLNQISLAVPKERFRKPSVHGMRIEQTPDYYILIPSEEIFTKSINLLYKSAIQK